MIFFRIEVEFKERLKKEGKKKKVFKKSKGKDLFLECFFIKITIDSEIESPNAFYIRLYVSTTCLTTAKKRETLISFFPDETIATSRGG